MNGEPSLSSFLFLVGTSVAAIVALYASDAVPRRGGPPLSIGLDWPQSSSPNEQFSTSQQTGWPRQQSAYQPYEQPQQQPAPYQEQQPDALQPPLQKNEQASMPYGGPAASPTPGAYAPYQRMPSPAYPIAPSEPSQEYRPSAPQAYPGMPPDYDPKTVPGDPQP